MHHTPIRPFRMYSNKQFLSMHLDVCFEISPSVKFQMSLNTTHQYNNSYSPCIMASTFTDTFPLQLSSALWCILIMVIVSFTVSVATGQPLDWWWIVRKWMITVTQHAISCFSENNWVCISSCNQDMSCSHNITCYSQCAIRYLDDEQTAHSF